MISATVAELPAQQRRSFERQLSNGTRAQLSAAMKGWVEGAGLDAESFRVRYFGFWSSTTAAQHIQSAARAIAQGDAGYTRPGAASADLAAAVQQVGIGNWTRFVADARERGQAAAPLALPHQPAQPPDTHVAGIRLAAAGDLRCEGFSGGCQSGGSFGSTAMYGISGRNLCADCAVKSLGIQDEPAAEKVMILSPFLLPKK